MKLTYRGNTYEYAPVVVEATAEEIIEKYRGVSYQRHLPRYTPRSNRAYELKYRGATYYSGNPEAVETLKQRQKLNSIFAKSKQLFVRNKNHNQNHNDELNHARSANLCRDLQRRLEIAKQKGDQSLILMLQEEANQLSITDCQLSFSN